MDRQVEPSAEDDWVFAVVDDEDDLAEADGGERAADTLPRVTSTRLEARRRIELLREQQLLRAAIEDLDHYVL